MIINKIIIILQRFLIIDILPILNSIEVFLLNKAIPILQLLVIGGWITLFTYSFLRKLSYFTRTKIWLLFLVCFGYTVLNSALFSLQLFRVDWYAFLFYATQLTTVVMIALNFHEKEIKADKLKESEISLELFSKITNYSPRVICAIEHKTNILLYANNAFKKVYPFKEGDLVDNYTTPYYMEIYNKNNEETFLAKGRVLEFLEEIENSEAKKFVKFFIVMDNKDSIIILAND
jgi:hypothetical protein